VIVSTPVLSGGCPGNDGESRLAGGNMKTLVDEGPDRAAA
jgi:hypothetical protein